MYAERKVLPGLALLYVCLLVSGWSGEVIPLRTETPVYIHSNHLVVVQFDALEGNHDVQILRFILDKLEQLTLAPDQTFPNLESIR